MDRRLGFRARRTTHSAVLLLAAVLLAVALLASCGEDAPSAEPSSYARIPDLRVEYAGCRTVLQGPVCELASGHQLSLWISAAGGAPVVIEADGELVESTGVEVQVGMLHHLDLGQAHRLVVRALGTGAEARWELELRPPAEPEWLGEARSLWRSGRLDEAREVLESASAADEPGLVSSALARLALRADNTDGARTLLERAIEHHHRRGRIFDEVRDAAALIYLLTYKKHDLAAARRVLEGLPKDWGGPAEVNYNVAYYGGLLAARSGDLRTGLRSVTTAASQAKRLGLSRLRLVAEQVLLGQLQQVGRLAEARVLLKGILENVSADLDACDRGQLLNNVGLIGPLIAFETGETAEDPLRSLREALRLFEEECTRLPDERLNVRLNLALIHLYAGDLDAARGIVAEVRRQGPVPELRMLLWLLDLEARIALLEARPEAALESYDEMARLAEAGLLHDAHWRASVGRAQALESLGRRTEALSALGEAERQLEAASRLVAITGGRDSFVAQREEGIRLFVDLLLRHGQPRAAFDVARRSRSRLLRDFIREERLARLSTAEQQRWDRVVSTYQKRRAALDQAAADDWKLSRDRLRRLEAERVAVHRQLLQELDEALAILGGAATPDSELDVPPSLDPRDLLLLYHPTTAGWVGFALDGEGLVARRLRCEISDPPPPELGGCLLEPFADRIAASRQIRMLPYGQLRQIDFHSLAFSGDLLVAARPVIYGLDLPRQAEPQTADSSLALLIADPSGDLPAARREAVAVEEVLGAEPNRWQIRVLRGGEATGSEVRRQLSTADLFHYAGHAGFAGGGGWDSALPLSGGSRLTVGDILMLDRAPSQVVLSGCETGRTSSRAAAESVSLAHAFLVAGSRSVVAATRPVADSVAMRLVTAYYRARASGLPPGRALRDAQIDLRRHDPGADWSSFRLIEL